MTEKTMYIDVDEIKIDDMQSRMGHWNDDAKDDALVNSMKGIGQIQDVIVRPLFPSGKEKFKYGLVAGSRRYHALIKAGKPKIHAIVKNMDDIEALETSISENIGQKDLTLFEESTAIYQLHELLMKKKGMGNFAAQKEIAKILYGNEDRADKINSVLGRIRDFPPQILILLKKPEERTKEEKRLLKKYGIPLNYPGMTKGISEAFHSLTLKLNSISVEDKTDKLLTAFKELHLYLGLREDEIRKRIIKLRDLITEGNPFAIALHKAKEESLLFDVLHKFRIPEFYLPSERHWEWHGKAVERSRMEPTELVQKVYTDWLEKEAKREGW